MFRNMVTSFLDHERITTTDAKAKELRSIAEKMITLGKRGDLHAQRQAASYIRDKKVVTKLFSTIAPRYMERDGGYTRIIKLGIRPGDNASLSVIELVEEQVNKKEKKAKPTKIAATAAVAMPAAASPAGAVEESAPQSTVADAAEACEGKAD
ncbi:50S ribosomal protein L17 [Geobacteraceae bacterium]|nr:50S ribosomal protein L17 [Geobacteraceae bacterium]